MIQRRSLVPNVEGSYYQQPPPQQQAASRHRAGHHSGLHPEDAPFISNTDRAPASRTRQTKATTHYDTVLVDEEELDEEDIDEGDYLTRPPRSAIRYNADLDGRPQPAARRRRIEEHYHDEPYERRREPAHRKRFRVHWMLKAGIFISLILIGLSLFSMAKDAVGTMWQQHQDDVTYGNPRTYQVNAVVGHADSNSNPSHFIGLNLNGRITVTEAPGGDMTKAIVYHFPTIVDNAGNPPVTIQFQDFDNDGRLDMVVKIGDPGSQVTYMMQNDGKQFVSKV